jgi:hypothetical protein
MEDFWQYYNRKTVVSVTEITDPLEDKEKLRILRLFCDDLLDPDMYGKLIPADVKARVRKLRERCWNCPNGSTQGDQ